MKVTYTGKLDALVPQQRKKLDAKLAKLGKLVDGKDQREAHVIVLSERHVYLAEIAVHLHDHPLVGVGSSPDLLTALTAAIDKLEKQAGKLRAKWRDTKRGPEKSLRTRAVQEPEAAAEPEPVVERQVFRANHRANQKPLTLEEALLVLEDGRDYLVYRDADSDRLSVLLRRRDGNFDLVEA